MTVSVRQFFLLTTCFTLFFFFLECNGWSQESDSVFNTKNNPPKTSWISRLLKRVSRDSLVQYKNKFREEVSNESADSVQMKKIFNGTVGTLSDYIGTRMLFDNDVTSFAIRSGDINYSINPNAETVTRWSISYKFITLSYAYVFPFLPGNGQEDLKGKTKSKSYGVDMIFRRVYQHLSYNRTRGYYLKNTGDFISGWNKGDAYIQFPDLQYSSFKGITGFVFNPRFSLRAFLAQSERQLKSAGSFYATLSYQYYIVDDQSPLYAGRTSQRSDNLQGIASLGYLHTFVIKSSWYFSLGLIPGYGVLYSNIKTRSTDETVTSEQYNQLYVLQLKGGMGYNGLHFYTGLYANFDELYYQQQNSSVKTYNNRFLIQLFLGYRFNVPKALNTFMKRIDKLWPGK